MTDAVLATPWTTFLRHANLHEQHKCRRSPIAVTAALDEGQHAHLFVCGRECGRKLRGTTRTNRHRDLVGNRSLRDLRRVVATGGRLVLSGGGNPGQAKYSARSG